MLEISEVAVQKCAHKLVKRKTAANSLEVLSLSFLDIHCPNSFDNKVNTATKGRLNLRKTSRCFGRRTCYPPLLVFTRLENSCYQKLSSHF